VKEPNRPVTAIGDHDHVLIGQVRDALRLLQPVDPLKDLSGLNVDNIDAVVTEFGDEQSLPGTIDRHVIDAARDVFEWDCSLEDQRWTRRCRAD
jgi:hypothetical protein